MRETSIGCLLHAPQPGTKPTTQECALTRNRTGDLLLCRMTLNQLSPAGQGGGGFEPHHQRGHGFLLLYTFFLKCLLKSCITSVDTQLLKQSTFLKQHLYTQIFFSFPSMSLKLRVNPKAQFMHVCVCVYVHTCVYMYTHIYIYAYSFYFFLKILFISRQRGMERGRRRESSMCGCLLHIPPPGTRPATQACALTGNRTGDPFVHRLALNPLSHTSQGYNFYFCCLSMKTTLRKEYFDWQMEKQLALGRQE